MSDEQIALARLGSILEDVYKKYRDEGTVPNDRKQYFSGFADALMTLKLLNQSQLEALVFPPKTLPTGRKRILPMRKAKAPMMSG